MTRTVEIKCDRCGKIIDTWNSDYYEVSSKKVFKRRIDIIAVAGDEIVGPFNVTEPLPKDPREYFNHYCVGCEEDGKDS
jgi:hypothetical protein